MLQLHPRLAQCESSVLPVQDDLRRNLRLVLLNDSVGDDVHVLRLLVAVPHVKVNQVCDVLCLGLEVIHGLEQIELVLEVLVKLQLHLDLDLFAEALLLAYVKLLGEIEDLGELISQQPNLKLLSLLDVLVPLNRLKEAQDSSSLLPLGGLHLSLNVLYDFIVCSFI